MESELEPANLEPDVERFVEVGGHPEGSGVPRFRRREIGDVIDHGSKSQEHGGSSMETGRAALAAQHTSSGARVRLRPRSLRGGSAGRILWLLTGRGPARYAVSI